MSEQHNDTDDFDMTEIENPDVLNLRQEAKMPGDLAIAVKEQETIASLSQINAPLHTAPVSVKTEALYKAERKRRGKSKKKKGLMPFPKILPEELENYFFAKAKKLSCPDDFLGVAAMTATSVLAGSSIIEIEEGMIFNPNLYSAIVSRSGEGKTPAIKSVLEISVDKIASNLASRSKREEIVATQQQELYQLKLKKWKSEFRKNPDAGKDCIPEKPDAYKHICVSSTDSTTESLAQLLDANKKGMILVKDELSGWIQSLDQYRTKGADTEFFLSTWSGVQAQITRKNQPPILVERPRLSVLGGIVPDNLKLLNGKTENGFFERIFCCYPESKKKIRSSEPVNPALKTIAEEYFSRIQSHGKIVLNDEAKKMYWDFVNSIDEKQNKDYKPYRSKLTELLGKFSLLLTRLWTPLEKNLDRSITENFLEISKRQDVTVCNEKMMQMAIELTEYAESHYLRTQGKSKETAEAQQANAVLNYVKKKERKGKTIIKVRDLCRSNVAGCNNAKSTRLLMQDLVDLEEVEWFDGVIGGAIILKKEKVEKKVEKKKVKKK